MSIVERPCPNCGAVNSLQLDVARGEVACEECAIVIAAGLEEDASTRYVKDAVIADADEDTRGGFGGGSSMGSRADQSSSGGSQQDVSKALNSRIVSYLRTLQQKSKTSDALFNDAVELCRLLSVKKRERNERIEKPQATAAACFQFASLRSQTPVSNNELVAIDRALSLLDIKVKLQELLTNLNLRMLPVQAIHRHSIRFYLQRLRWNLVLCEVPAVTVAHCFERLKIEKVDVYDEVVGALCWIRWGKDTLLALESKKIITSQQVEDLQYKSNKTALIQEIASATRCPSARIEEIMAILERERKTIAESVRSMPSVEPEPHPSRGTEKRPRSE